MSSDHNTSPLECMIIDSDTSSLREIKRVVMKDKRLTIAQSCKSGRAAVLYLRNREVDLIIMNPALPDVNGFDMIQRLRTNTPVVVLADRDDYAYFAFGIDAVDYILRPFTQLKLSASMDRVMRRIKANALAEKES